MKRLLLALLLLVLLLFGPSCGKHYLAFRTYPGPKKPLSEVAVILARKPVLIDEVDGKRTPWSKYIMHKQLHEIHLLPGSHIVKAYYREHPLLGVQDTVWSHCLKGQVYEAQHEISWDHSLGRPYISGWTLSLERIGSIKEVATKNRKRQASHWKPYVEKKRKTK